ncbi:hypothetical protein COOONC_12749, partial [Cooperia oncophora]
LFYINPRCSHNSTPVTTFQIDKRLGGVTTDAELHVRSGIWAAGDTASFYDKSLGRRRIEHWENAQVSGRLAGENMTGAGKAFWYQPAFFSKIAPHWHINAVGITDSSLPTVSVFAKDDNANESFERGVVFYKGDDGKVVGVLLLNVYGSGVDVSRRLIEEARSVDDFQQLAKLYAEPEEQEKRRKKNLKKSIRLFSLIFVGQFYVSRSCFTSSISRYSSQIGVLTD